MSTAYHYISLRRLGEILAVKEMDRLIMKTNISLYRNQRFKNESVENQGNGHLDR